LGDALGEERLQERIEEIRGIIDRLDQRWELGFIDKDEYIERRLALVEQLESLQPLPEDDLKEAAHILEDFPELWAEADLKERQRLLNLVLARVWVKGKRVSALMLKPAYHIVITSAEGENQNEGSPAPKLSEGTPLSPQGMRLDTMDTEKKPCIRPAKNAWLYGPDGDRVQIAIPELLVVPLGLRSLMGSGAGGRGTTRSKMSA